ncbi:hypothetical protein [Mongoliitalea daihaiensis]|uniref:hypothetical protein n=1 Tax=Mongoliitalea daihaiensis TaxID=2782006 RepID=UPI001F2AE9C7|nr:hypothetical protein [Mongoliitalea daihaiensis]UJP63984.1 hypothetical protein IPZ59_14290 [Mongoliitalea daihaiensis]
MIRFVKNGNFRTSTVTIKRFVNGQESTADGFPIVESLLEPFGSFEQISNDQLISLTNFAFQQRVNAFRTYLTNKYSFLAPTDFTNQAFGTDSSLCVPGTIVSENSIEITNDTNITIFFDSSGSMNSSLQPLITMRNTLLRDALLPFYGNDNEVYDQRVRVISEANERTFWMLNNRGQEFNGRNLIMIFQDEAAPVYTSFTAITPRTTTFNNDITDLRNRLSALPQNSYRGIIFQVTRIQSDGLRFKELIEAVQNGIPPYEVPFGLSDRTEFGYSYDILNGGTPQYYMDLVITKMRQLGYRI